MVEGLHQDLEVTARRLEVFDSLKLRLKLMTSGRVLCIDEVSKNTFDFPEFLIEVDPIHQTFQTVCLKDTSVVYHYRY